MFNRKLIVFLFLALGIAAPAWSQADSDIELAISDAISQLHPSDSPQWWRALGPTAPTIIIRMYESTSRKYARIRLLEGLGWFKENPRVIDFLKQQGDQSQDEILRSTAVQAVANAGGASEIDYVSKFLSHSDAQTRLSAAQALKRMNNPRALAVLEKYFQEERAAWIVSKVKGDPGAPLAPLTVAASSDDKPNSAFAGYWQGYWIYPDIGKGKTGLESDPATLEISLPSTESGQSQLQGELTLIAGKAPARKLQLTGLKAKGLKMSGVLPAELKTGAGASRSFDFQAEMKDQATAQILEFGVPLLGGTLILRKKRD